MSIITFNNTKLVNEPFSLEQDLENSEKEFETLYLDLNQVKYNEQNNSNNFLLNLNVSSYVENVLFNITDERSYEQLENNRNNLGVDFQYSIEEVLYELDGDWGYHINTEEELCDHVKFLPSKNDLLLNVNNYDLKQGVNIDKEDIIINNEPLSHGLELWSTSIIIHKGKKLILCVSILPHNLIKNVNILLLVNNEITIKSKVYDIYEEDSLYKFTIPYDILFNENETYTFKKLVRNNPVEYYLELFTEISVINDENEIYYANNLKNNKKSFLNEINITNNLKESYIYFNKKTFVNSITYDNIKYGVNTFHEVNNCNKNKINQGNNYELSTSNENPLRIVEFNPFDQSITILSDIYHIFNSKNRNENGFFESYMYIPYLTIPLKKESELLQEYGDNGLGHYDGHKSFYRNLISNSLTDYYPFLNQKHIINYNFNFFLKRQDMYNKYEKGSTFHFIHYEETNYDETQELSC